MSLKTAVTGFAEAIRSKTRMDGWFNAITGLGGSKDKTTYHQVYYSPFLQPAELEALYYSNDLAATIVDAPVEQAMMLGFDVSEDTDGLIKDALQKWQADTKVRDAAIWGRLFGAGALLLGVNRGLMDTPLELEQVRQGDLKYIMVLDRQDIAPVSYYEDPDHEKFGEVEVYQVHKSTASGKLPGKNIHESRLILFGGERTSARMKERNHGFDLSVLQRPYDTLRDSDANWKSIVHVMQGLSQAVFKVQGLINMIAEGDVETMQNRMLIVDMARSVARAMVVDAEMESFEQVGAQNVGGIGEVLEKTFQRLAAAARMPVTILMGMSPSGMNATGESDMRSWFNRLQVQREELDGPLVLLVKIIAATEGLTLPDEPSIVWPSLWQMSPTEKAEHRLQVAQTDKIYIDSGVLLPEEVTVARWGKGEYSDETAGSVDIEAREKLAEEEIKDLLDPPDPPPMLPPQPPGVDPSDQEPPQPPSPDQEDEGE